MQPEENTDKADPFSLSSYFPDPGINRALYQSFDYVSGLKELRSVYRTLQDCRGQILLFSPD